MATHSSILAWKIPWTEEPDRLQSIVSQRDMTEATWHVCSATQSCLLFPILWTVACQAPLSMGFSRQEYWSGLPFPPPGALPLPGTEPAPLLSSALAGGLFTLVLRRKPVISSYTFYWLLPGFILSGDGIAQYVFCKLSFCSALFLRFIY